MINRGIHKTEESGDVNGPTNLEARSETPARAPWRKPVVSETNCGLEINCYAASSRKQRRR